MFTLQLLGALDLRDPSGQQVRSLVAQPKRVAVLAYLTLHEGFCRRDALLPVFWPEQDQEHARAALRKVIYHLRQSLGEHAIVGRGDEEIAFSDEVVRCDAREMRRAVARGDAQVAIELYRGDLLPGFNIPDVPDFECWLDAQREKLRLDAARAADALAESCRASGKLAEALEWSRRRLSLTPADEPAFRRLLRILEETGDRSGAVEAFEHFALQLRLTYGLEPSPETRELVEHIRASDRNLAGTAARAEPRPNAPGTESTDGVAAATPAARIADPAPARPPVRPRHLRWQHGAVFVSLVLPALLFLRAPILTFVHNAFGGGTTSLAARSDDLSIAVLPIVDVSRGVDAEYLAVGMTDELINALGRLDGLRVAARTSTFALGNDSADVREVARKLGVRYVLEGSLRREGSHVRLSLQLIDATDGQQRWADTYDRGIGDVLGMQEEVSGSVITALKGPLALPSPTLRATRDPEAYDHYLRGRFLLNQRNQESVQSAIRYFSAALARDTSYALAYAGLADAYLSQADWVTPRSVLPKAKVSASRALQLDDQLYESHLALAKVLHRFEWDWAGAERQFKRAVELAPDEPLVRHQYSEFLSASRRFDEAVAEKRRGLALEKARATDPVQFMVYEREALAAVLFRAHRYREAITMAESALDLDPRSNTRMVIVYASQMLGDFSRASKEMERIAADRVMTARQSVAAARNSAHAGNFAEARRLLEQKLEQAQRQYVPRDQIAQFYLAVGDTTKALEALETAVNDRNWFMVFWNSDPFAESLRDQPRFQRLLRRMNTPA